MFGEEGKLQQLKIYYLFMYADGASSPSEMKYLKDIIAKEKLSDTTVEEFQTFCGQMALDMMAGNSQIVIAKIDELLGEKPSNPSVGMILAFTALFSNILDYSKVLQAQTIWTLINLGYADSDYSEAEKAVVNHLVERWETDPLLVAELSDTAETISALTAQKEWIQTTSKPYPVVNGIIEELDRNITAMFANVEISISEADVA